MKTVCDGEVMVGECDMLIRERQVRTEETRVVKSDDEGRGMVKSII